MIYVSVLDVSFLYDEKKKTEYLQKLSESRREKALSLKSEREQVRSIGAGFLLEDIIGKQFLLSEKQIKELKYETSEHGKPYLVEYPEVCFNLSHSGDYVACAVSDIPVGIDVQFMGKYRENVAKRFFSKEENKTLFSTELPEEQKKMFYQIWTGKESYTKWLETGLTISLSDFTIDLQKEKVTGKNPCNLKYFNIAKNYCCCLAFKGQQEIIFEKRVCEDA